MPHQINKTAVRFYLFTGVNEKHKDVISLEDFIKQIEINTRDIMNVPNKYGQSYYDNFIGYNLLTDIFEDRVKKCDVVERPFHCIMDKDHNINVFMKNNEWTEENIIDYEGITPIFNKMVYDLVVRINEDIDNPIDNTVEIAKDLKEIFKKFKRNKKSDIEEMKNLIYYKVQINKHQLNYDLLSKNNE